MKSIKSMLSIVALAVLAACSVAPAYAQTDAELMQGIRASMKGMDVTSVIYGKVRVVVAIQDETAYVYRSSGNAEYDRKVVKLVQDNIYDASTNGIAFPVEWAAPEGKAYTYIPRSM